MCFAKNEAIETEIEDVLVDIRPQTEARDAAKTALATNQAAQEQMSRRVRELDGLVYRAQKDDIRGSEALRMIAGANRKAEECNNRLEVLRAEEPELRSTLAKAQFELNQAAIRIIEPPRSQQQAQVSALVDRAYEVADSWKAAVDRIAHEHGIEFPTPRHVALNPLCHERVSRDRFGIPSFGQQEAANA